MHLSRPGFNRWGGLPAGVRASQSGTPGLLLQETASSHQRLMIANSALRALGEMPI